MGNKLLMAVNVLAGAMVAGAETTYYRDSRRRGEIRPVASKALRPRIATARRPISNGGCGAARTSWRTM